jgi:hypothetical protein
LGLLRDPLNDAILTYSPATGVQKLLGIFENVEFFDSL